MSIISAGTTLTSALVQTGDTNGNLVLQTNGTTTAVTIGTDQTTTLEKPLILKGSTSGTITVQATAVAGSNTLTLPAGTGTAVVNGVNGSIVSGTALAYNWNGSTSNTVLDFTGIPSWVKRVTVMFNGVSTSGTNNYLVQIGSGSVTSSGYVAGSGNISGGVGYGTISSTAGFITFSGEAANNFCGNMIICLIGSNTYVSSHSLADTAGTYVNAVNGGGSVTLSGALDRVRITTVNGTDTFDAGSVNILYE